MNVEMACEAQRNLATEAQRHGENPHHSLCLGVFVAHSLSSRLSATEVRRAGRRQPNRRVLQQAEEVLDSFVFLEVTPAILKRAGALGPTDLRTLDAIHLATALGLGLADLEFLTYDARLARAARAQDPDVVVP